MDKRIIELAIEALEIRKAAVETEIAGLRAVVGKQRRHAATPSRTVSSRKRSGQSRQRAQGANAKHAGARSTARKRGPQSAAARKAISERMKAYWAKQKSGR